MTYLLLYLSYIQTQLTDGASDTLRELSPWAYVIVVFALAVAGTFLKLYVSEKQQNDNLELEFRKFMSDTITQQIEVSRDVIDLVTRNKNDIKEALHSHSTSDIRVENLITEVRGQLSRIEEAVKRFNN